MPTSPISHRLKIAAAGILVAMLILVLTGLLLLSMGWGLVRPLAERRASSALGRQVTIARIDRIGGGLFHPLLAVEGVRVAQPSWAETGDMVQVRSARVRIAALPLFTGRLRSEAIFIDGLRASLIRSPSGQANWKFSTSDRDGEGRPDFGRLILRHALVTWDDRPNQHRFAMQVSSDSAGLRINGTGEVGGTPATLAVTGAPVQGSGPWPFRAVVASGAVTLRAAGAMRTPLDLGHFTARAESSGRNLVDLDHLIEAGLPDTQPFALSATVAHDGPTWVISNLAGRIGRSDLAGNLTVRKLGDRVRLDGNLRSNGFDFDDLATDAQLAQAGAISRRIGPRIVPSTRIRLDHLRKLDGALRLDITKILSRSPTVFRSLKTTLSLDHAVLTATPLIAGLAAGTLSGSAIVRHPSGTPQLTLDLRLSNGRVEQLMHTADVVSGPLVGRARLQGRGSTVREAIGRADGRIALVAAGGTVTRRVALFVGADVGRGLFEGNSERATVRCIVGDFSMSGGVARPDPLVFDSSVARADGSGTVRMADEAVAIDLRGRPKQGSVLRLNGPISVRGTLSAPTFNPPPQTRTVSGILKMVGKALGGDPQPLGRDANCSALEAKALR